MTSHDPVLRRVLKTLRNNGKKFLTVDLVPTVYGEGQWKTDPDPLIACELTDDRGYFIQRCVASGTRFVDQSWVRYSTRQTSLWINHSVRVLSSNCSECGVACDKVCSCEEA